MNKNFWLTKINIGGQKYSRFMAAPLDGIIDSPMRQLMRIFSPTELFFTEMRHVGCVAYEKIERSVSYVPQEQPLAFQISTSSTRFLEPAVEKVLANNFKFIDLNSGCPAKCVIKSGSGSALMANLPMLKEILTSLKKIINNRCPLTIKIRAGFKEKNGLDVALLAQDCGVDMLTIHPRTQPGGFSALLDFDLVRQIKEKTSIPIVFSGNLNSFKRIQEAYEKTGVDGFMIGRALWGAPWKMHEILCQQENKEFLLTQREKIEYAIKHLELNVKFYGSHGVHALKKQLSQYLKGFENAREWRNLLLRSQNEIEMQGHLQELLQTTASQQGCHANPST